MPGDIYKKAVDTFGAESQLWMAIEEMGELITSIARYKRGRTDKSEPEEEIEDVLICVKQLRHIFDGDKCKDWKLTKTCRLVKTIEKHKQLGGDDDMEKKPRGIRNNNPGNIRHKDAWIGLTPEQPDPSFCTFESMAYGIRALAKTLITYRDKYKLKNPEQVIKRWAPKEDGNDTAAYIRHVEKVVPRRLWNLEGKEALTEYARAICIHENGARWSSEWIMYLDEGIKMALA
jgi:NTP pyrophosphatase (non-canonical NTP hydrolase)